MEQGGMRNYVSASFRLTESSTLDSSRNRHEDISNEMSKVMDNIGYARDLRKKRRDCYMENDRLLNENTDSDANCIRITVGSKGEGLTWCCESDRDNLYIFPLVACLEDGFGIHSIPEKTAVFRMNTKICYPGHCILMLERGFPVNLFSAVIDDGHGNLILSSGLCINVFKMFKTTQGFPLQERAGPALPILIGAMKMDIVFALRCHCPSILQKWAKRPRHWPPPDIVQKVVSMGAFVTPVGFKGSDNKHVEWRICFNAGETELVINLNDTLVKIYVLLKMIAKDVLKPKHKEITSYTLKNIVLWLAEKNPQTIFHKKSLFYWLRESLHELKTAICTKQLPYFIIPERNLMEATGLTDAQQRTWISTITDMMEEGPEIIRRLPKIRNAIIAHPETLLWYNSRRIELEIMILEQLNGNNISIDEAFRRTIQIVIEVFLRMLFDGSFYKLLIGGISVNSFRHILSRMLM